MAALSGKEGKIVADSTEVCEIRNWRFTTSASNPQYASNKTGGFKTSAAGVKFGRGSFQYVLDPDNPLTNLFDEGDEVTLLLHIDDTRFYTVPARIDSIGVEVDIDDTADVVGGPVEFHAMGAWTKPNYS